MPAVDFVVEDNKTICDWGCFRTITRRDARNDFVCAAMALLRLTLNSNSNKDIILPKSLIVGQLIHIYVSKNGSLFPTNQHRLSEIV